MGGIGFILYFFLKGQSQQDSTAAVSSVDTRPSVPSPRQVSDDVDRSVTSASCWIAPGHFIDVKGLGSIGGMLYYGKGLARVTGSGVEPALINPGLPVKMPAGPVEQMPYWPSYSDISPTARGGYLQWLADGRICLVVFDAERERLRNVLYDIANDSPPRPEELAQSIQNKVREKWDVLLTDELLCKSFASREIDVIEATTAAKDIADAP